MNTERQQFEKAFAQAKAEGRWLAPIIRTRQMLDPLTVYRNICAWDPDTACVMESATHDGTKGRFSYVCVRGSELFSIHDSKHFTWLKEMLARYSPPAHPTLPFIGGGVGYLSYELITLIETSVPLHVHDSFGLPLCVLYFFTDLVVFDHEQGEMHYVANARVSEQKDIKETYTDGCRQIAELERMAMRQSDVRRAPPLIGPIQSNMTRSEYHDMVLRAKEHIAAGDIFQVVLSQRFEAPYETGRLEEYGLPLYEKLRELNPSPYMFHMRFGHRMNYLTLLGASPEIAVHIAGGEMRVRPIAGTRKRGATPEEDRRLAEELKTDPKELAEHRMLVDLARNDIGRFCKADSIHVPELMEVELYSHVMHLTSEVRGMLRDGVHSLDATLGSLPAGTLSGAPKIRAMQLISELEKSRRGPYGGAFGWMTDTATDTCIFIRSAVLHKGALSWQSGGGIVADSEPEAEYQESLAKARAIETALQQIGRHWKSHE